eukprot:2667258-Amphidinium_carterae.1
MRIKSVLVFEKLGHTLKHIAFNEVLYASFCMYPLYRLVAQHATHDQAQHCVNACIWIMRATLDSGTETDLRHGGLAALALQVLRIENIQIPRLS